MNKFFLLILVSLFTLSAFANIDISISSPASQTLIIAYKANTDFNSAPFNIWNSQVFTIRWSNDLGANVITNTQNLSAFQFVLDGSTVDGNDGFYYQKFTAAMTNITVNMDANTALDVLEISLLNDDVCGGDFELVTDTPFVNSIFGTASVNNVLGEQFNVFDPALTADVTLNQSSVFQIWYEDADGDGKGTSSTTETDCEQPMGFVGNSDDCDDNDPNLPATPGTACDDGNNQTINDEIQSDGCTCEGVLVDCPTLNLNIGDPCDDGDATTDNDTVNANCDCEGTPTNCAGIGDADGDGICANVDCDDTDPEVTDAIGDTCNDGDPCTTNDVLDANCNCSGTFQDSDGDGTCDAEDICPGGPEPGTPCDDSEPTTTNDQITVDCDCQGTPTNCTGIGDADADGVCADIDCNDNDPQATGEMGAACDDGDPCTENDQIFVGCDCIGTFADDDGDGVCNAIDVCPGSPEPGMPCDDNDPNTFDDTVDPNCECIGVPDNCLNIGDADGDGICADIDCDDNDPQATDAIGAACNDGDPCTENDQIVAGCDCVGTFVDDDGDGVCNYEDQCPGGPEPSTPCDDGDPDTVNDQIAANCECEGTSTDCTGIGDADGDGICTDEDCDDNDPQATNVIGTACDDGDPCTENDQIVAGCDCVGTFADDDGDGVCNANDQCPDHPDPGQPCDDTDPNTINDQVDDNCECSGTPINCPGIGDNDNDGVCADVDCDDNDPQATAVIGAICDDGDPCTENDEVQSDCLCAGTYSDDDGDGVCNADDICPGFDDSQDSDGDGIPDGCDTPTGDPDCSDVNITTTNSSIEFTGLTAPIEILKVFDSSWTTVFTCFDNCGDAQTVSGLSSGTYYYTLDMYTENWQSICEQGEYITLGGGNPCQGQGGDSDNDGVCDDDDICPGYDDNQDSDGDGIPDGCDTPIGDPDCSDVNINPTNNSIEISGLTAPIEIIHVFSSSWATVFTCFDNCGAEQSVTGLGEGTYYVAVKMYTTDWIFICERTEYVMVGQAGPCMGQGGDSDGDGVCDNTDACPGYDDNDDSDGDGIPDGCDTPGGDPDCSDVNIVVTNNSIEITGLTAAIENVKLFDSNWSNVFTCFDNCGNAQTITGLSAGTYYIDIKMYEAGWQFICELGEYVDVGGGGDPCQGQGGDSDGDGVCDDDDICPGFDDNQDSDGDGIPDGCDTPGDPGCGDVNITSTSSSIEITGLTAPIEIVKIFDSSWATIFTCFDNCGGEQIVSGLSQGTYYVSVKMYTDSWGSICEMAEYVILGGGSNLVVLDAGTTASQQSRLNWSHYSTQAPLWYHVERSPDSLNFETILILPANGLANTPEHLSDLDRDPLKGVNYYRLKVIYEDGSTAYSAVVKVFFDPISDFEPIPNPATDMVQIYLKNYSGKAIELNIYNTLGHRLYHQRIDQVVDHLIPIDLKQQNIGGGVYMVTVVHKGRARAKRLVVARH